MMIHVLAFAGWFLAVVGFGLFFLLLYTWHLYDKRNSVDNWLEAIDKHAPDKRNAIYKEAMGFPQDVEL